MPRQFSAILFKPFYRFLEGQALSGIILLMAAAAAVIMANSSYAHQYESFWHWPLGFQFGEWQIKNSLHFWINDGLMAVFFLMVGLEIKRELLVGELSTPRKAALPVMAAVGGMLVPVVLYVALNLTQSNEALRGWGIPAVTDIAFTIGVLALLGSRIPLALKVFVTALAIVDDIGAILLIALFYSSQIHLSALGGMVLILAILLLLNRRGIYNILPYYILGFALWLATLASGLHATIAGVLLAAVIPAQSRIQPVAFEQHARAILHHFSQAHPSPKKSIMLTNEEQQNSLQELENLCDELQSPLQQLEHVLQPLSNFVILPLFALANAGIILPSWQEVPAALSNSSTLGIVAGLLLGKQLGIAAFSWLAVKLGWADLPEGIRWPQLYGAAILCGIGFTMSMFISALAFTDRAMLLAAKIGILLGSLLSAVIGALVLKCVLRPLPSSEPKP